jgi:hypothetical protein
MKTYLNFKSFAIAAGVILVSTVWSALFAADNGSFTANLAGTYTGKYMLIGAIVGGVIGLISSFGKKK